MIVPPTAKLRPPVGLRVSVLLLLLTPVLGNFLVREATGRFTLELAYQRAIVCLSGLAIVFLLIMHVHYVSRRHWPALGWTLLGYATIVLNAVFFAFAYLDHDRTDLLWGFLFVGACALAVLVFGARQWSGQKRGLRGHSTTEAMVAAKARFERVLRWHRAGVAALWVAVPVTLLIGQSMKDSADGVADEFGAGILASLLFIGALFVDAAALVLLVVMHSWSGAQRSKTGIAWCIGGYAALGAYCGILAFVALRHGNPALAMGAGVGLFAVFVGLSFAIRQWSTLDARPTHA